MYSDRQTIASITTIRTNVIGLYIITELHYFFASLYPCRFFFNFTKKYFNSMYYHNLNICFTYLLSVQVLQVDITAGFIALLYNVICALCNNILPTRNDFLIFGLIPFVCEKPSHKGFLNSFILEGQFLTQQKR